MIDGKTKSITRPTKKEAERAAAELKIGVVREASTDKTLLEAENAYINQREDKLSPSTIRGYKLIRDHRLESLHHMKLRYITDRQWQAAIDEDRKRLAPKTIKNAWRFVRSVLEAENVPCPKVVLPPVVVPDLNFLTYKEIKKLQEEIKGSEYEIAILLALSSLRLSEILNVTIDDIHLDENTIDVHGSAVLDEHGELIHKEENKNATSRRTIPFIIPQLREAIERGHYKPGEYLIQYHPNSLWKAVNRHCDNAGITRCGMHDLRRSFVSLCVHLNIPLEYIRIIGGWANDTVIRQVYMKVADEDLKKASDTITEYFNNI